MPAGAAARSKPWPLSHSMPMPVPGVQVPPREVGMTGIVAMMMRIAVVLLYQNEIPLKTPALYAPDFELQFARSKPMPAPQVPHAPPDVLAAKLPFPAAIAGRKGVAPLGSGA